MKLSRKRIRLIVIGIGLFFIFFGIIQNVFNLEIKNRFIDTVFVSLFVLSIAFLYNNNQKKEADDGRTEEKEGTPRD